MADYGIHLIPTEQIKFFLRRARGESAYARLKESIREVGLKTPIGVRDISEWPAKERKKPSGGHYRYELVYGQGRLQAFRELGLSQIPAVIVDVPEEEIVGRFLAENVMRRKLSWREKAKLIAHDVEFNGLAVEGIASKYCVTLSHAKKYLRIISGASEKALKRAEQEDFDMGTAEKLTTLPKSEQDAVIEVLEDRNLDKTAIFHLVDQAARLRTRGRVTKDRLAESLDELSAELRKCRDRYKIKRLEYALGPQHLFRLSHEDESFKSRARFLGIDISHFSN